MDTTHGRSGSVDTRQWKALGIAAALLVLSMAGCTDATVAPKSTVTGANFFDDPGSYQAFLAKIYGGLALSGQSGPAGQPDISGIDERSEERRVGKECRARWSPVGEK